MVELGTRCTTERVHVGNSPPKVARTAFLPDGDGFQRSLVPRSRFPPRLTPSVGRTSSVSISGGQIPRSLLRLLEEVIVVRMSEYIHQSHNVSILMYHLVCPAKYRRVVF